MKYGKEDKMNELTKTIVENGITYVLGMDELYYPDLELQSKKNRDIGKYGILKLQYMQKLVEQIKEAAGITLTMKQTDFMRWIGQVNNIYSTAEEIILKEMVYNERL